MADMNKLKSRWQTRASAASGDLVDAYVTRTGKLDAAKSDAAEKAYAEGVAMAAQKKRRQRALGKLSEDDLNRGMREKGQSNYSTGVGASADKWERNAAPFVAEAERVAKSLPARTTNPMTNVDNRVKPVVKALSDLKDKQG